jgi:hypothetical protein
MWLRIGTSVCFFFFVNTVMDLRIPFKARNFLASLATVSFSRRPLLHGVNLCWLVLILFPLQTILRPPFWYFWVGAASNVMLFLQARSEVCWILTCWLHLQGEDGGRMLVSYRNAARRHNPEEIHLNQMRYLRFTRRWKFKSRSLKIETERSSETLVSYHNTTRHDDSEDLDLTLHANYSFIYLLIFTLFNDAPTTTQVIWYRM